MSDSPAKQFMKTRGRPAPSLPVALHLVDSSGKEQTEAEGAPAVFRFVSDKLKTDADADAAKAIAALSAGGEVSDEMRAAIAQSSFLQTAIRDAASPMSPFFDSADECRSMLMPTERIRLLGKYQTWIEVHFPDDFDSEKLKEAMADAETFTVGALLRKYEYDITRSCVISSELTRRRSQMPR